MKELTVLKFGQSERLDKMLEFSISEYDYHIITKVDDMNDLQNKRILFAIELGNSGINIEHMTMLTKFVYPALISCIRQ